MLFAVYQWVGVGMAKWVTVAPHYYSVTTFLTHMRRVTGPVSGGRAGRLCAQRDKQAEHQSAR